MHRGACIHMKDTSLILTHLDNQAQVRVHRQMAKKKPPEGGCSELDV
jgi:hypothetical protein